MRHYDLGLWDGRPAIAFLPDSAQVVLQDLEEPERTRRWRLPPRTLVCDLRLLGPAQDPAVLVATHEQSLLRYETGPDHPVHTARLGTEVLSLAPVSDELVGVATATGLLCLRLAHGVDH
ncbi:hypothetical protein [Streptomyces dysideae]|uniref:Uncharacterized protein n=1 Tax=Streptomyces dysideae TaxID=909626 RepID=A0A101USM1_9ACTN|nr:hypothetical protein [Streptomyces dysideae]KUO16035.1 hypothetical protein AQJ91_38055 [Streptomyces dysideae]